eukprot:gene1036-620_t
MDVDSLLLSVLIPFPFFSLPFIFGNRKQRPMLFLLLTTHRTFCKNLWTEGTMERTQLTLTNPTNLEIAQFLRVFDGVMLFFIAHAFRFSCLTNFARCTELESDAADLVLTF